MNDKKSFVRIIFDLFLKMTYSFTREVYHIFKKKHTGKPCIMRFETPLYSARLLQRVSTVLADGCFDSGETFTAYCSNVSKMNGLAIPGTQIYVSENPKKGHYIPFVWEVCDVNGTLVGVNVSHHYDLVLEGIRDGVLAELSGYEKSERILPSDDTSLMDVRLTPPDGDDRPVCKIAIASAYEKKGVDLLFPDTVYVANARIADQMEKALDAGYRVVFLILAQRIDSIGVKANWTADPVCLNRLKNLCDKGLEILCYGCTVTLEEIIITARLPFAF